MVGDAGWDSSLGLLPSFFWRLSTKTVGQLARRGGRADDRDRLVAGWPKLARGKTKSSGAVELNDRRDLVMVTPRKGFPFIPQWNATVIPKPTEVETGGAIWRWQHGAWQWSACEASATWSWPRERDGRATLWRRTIVALKRLGSNGPK
jgi:hypothetical protein